MIKPNEQFTAANTAAIESLLTIANATLANAERLAALNLNITRAFFADAAASVGALAAAKDPREFFALQSALAKPAVEKAVAYSQTIYEILSDSANGLAQHVEGHSAELKKSFSAAIEQSLTHAPAGSEAVVAAVKTALAQADSAYSTMAQSSKQAKAMIETTVASANAAAIKLMKAA
ncbi:MAG TPA: phasin family protein [Rhodocyclaceae bacterium]|nr:phasin family protein [Rhodocyclaceae bacterium]